MTKPKADDVNNLGDPAGALTVQPRGAEEPFDLRTPHPVTFADFQQRIQDVTDTGLAYLQENPTMRQGLAMQSMLTQVEYLMGSSTPDSSPEGCARLVILRERVTPRLDA